MNKTKIEKVVNVFCDNLGISKARYRETIKELLVNIIEKYEACGIKTIKDGQQYIMKNSNNEYSVEDFFLNRLLFNVTSMEFKKKGGRADYDPGSRSITFNSEKLKTLMDRYSNMGLTDEQKYLATKKVVMHEFEHALKAHVIEGPDLNDRECYRSLYKRLLDANLNVRLNVIYDGRNMMPYIRGKVNSIECGLHIYGDGDLYEEYYGTFDLNPNDSGYNGENNVDEIFNESESLEMSKSKQGQRVVLPYGNIIKVDNVESSNWLITNYGFMLKILLGERRTFEGLYLDRNVIIDYFNDNYGEIFEQVFGEHFRKKYPDKKIIDGWSMLHMAIDEAKYSYERGDKILSETCHVHINEALSLCLEKMIKEKMAAGESFESLKKQYIDFAKLTMFHPDAVQNDNLPHVKILNDLKEYMKQQRDNDAKKIRQGDKTTKFKLFLGKR